MKRSASYSLALPPRPVPWPVRAQLFLGSMVNQIGWIVFGVGMIFFWIFGLNSDLSTLRFRLSSYETTPGIISDIQSTSASENDSSIYAYHYIFRLEREEREYRGVSYTRGNPFEVGETVSVQYLAGNPEISRIEGARGALFGAWLGCFISLIPGVGVGLIGFGWWQGIKQQRLLVGGKVGLGRLVLTKASNTRINHQRVYKLTFEFKAEDGKLYQVTTQTHMTHRLRDEAQEQLLYDPDNPNRAVLLDNLPGEPDIDEFGNLQAGGSERLLRLLILPVIVLIIHGGVLLFVLVR